MTRRLQTFAATLLLAVLAAPATAQPAYDLFLLDPPGSDGTSVYPRHMNESGMVHGIFYQDGYQKDFVYDPTSDEYWIHDGSHDITGLSDRAELIGNVFDAATNLSFGVYASSPGAEPVFLAPLPGDVSIGANGINNTGIICGYSYAPDSPATALGEGTAVIWRVTDTGIEGPFPLPSPDGEHLLIADVVGPPNGNGVFSVVGSVFQYTAEGEYLGTLLASWTVKFRPNGTLRLRDGPTPLGQLGEFTTASAVNANGLVVGRSAGRGFKKTRSGDMRALERLDFGAAILTSESAAGVNDHNDIAGAANWAKRPGVVVRHAVLWVGGTSIVDLNDVVTLKRHEKLTHANDITNTGMILVEYISSKTGNYRTGILLPIRP